jgi:uncharacterized protein (DUF1330 family)
MPKGYWVVTYRSVSDPDALVRYGGPAVKKIAESGGRILARGMPVKVYEFADEQRCVVVEFDSVAAAIAAFENPEYQKIAAILQGGVEREVRIVEGT